MPTLKMLHPGMAVKGRPIRECKFKSTCPRCGKWMYPQRIVRGEVWQGDSIIQCKATVGQDHDTRWCHIQCDNECLQEEAKLIANKYEQLKLF